MSDGVRAFLQVDGVSIRYGEVWAVQSASLEVHEGEFVAIIGPNGAGKSTTLKAICGLVPIVSGSVTFRGQDVGGMPPHRLIPLGIGLAPEERHVFPTMSVYENLEMGAFSVRDRSAVRSQLEYVCQLLPILRERLRQKARTLSGGEQQLLSMGRALMIKPLLFLLDEPSYALSPNYARTVFETLATIHEAGTGILAVEQNARKVLEVADRAYVFRIGGIAMEGRSNELLGNPDVKAAFLGE